ncbi:hypothetical protein [Nocardioides sp. SYSU DS0651]|uniref:hypothetical protein n=1 Tax=Nocardioides sp. SYSU DS0651 TaxID=3415955 RepID=UPI003F4BC5C9
MLDTLLIAGGALLVVLVFVDALATTLAVSNGAGPLTSTVLAAAWRLALRLHRQDKESSLLTVAGPVILIVTVLTWVGMLWAGWTLVFLGSDAVVTAKNGIPAGPADVVYFTGFTIFTLGTGDFIAASPGWRIGMAAATFSGLFLVTLAITYLISVVSAVVERRALAVQVHGLGDAPSEILAKGWTGEQFGSVFEQQLVSLSTSVAKSAEQHLAYPVLHYFHSSTRRLAAPVALAHLDEALTVIGAMDARHRLEPSAVDPLRSAVSRYLETASRTASVPEVDVPPPPSTAGSAAADLPVDDTSVRRVAEQEVERRTRLHRLMTSDGWSWHGGGPRTDPHSPDPTD